MKPANSQIPLGKFAWLILVAVIATPTAFFLLVTPKEPDEPTAPPVEKRPLSKLESVGLRDYRDWDGLPEIFAIWSDKAHWENDRTRFAYWHPIARRYAYFFEATRSKDGYRFKEVHPTEIELTEVEAAEDDGQEGEFRSELHPLLFLNQYYVMRPKEFFVPPTKPDGAERGVPPKVQIELPKKP